MKNKKLIKSVLRITLIVIAATIIGFNVYHINASRLAGNVVPMPFGVGAAVVISGSMEPELSIGDMLIVVQQDEYEVDNIIVYQEGRMAITHRIISMENGEVITRGDANNTDDSPITVEQIKGKVVLAIPFVGYIVNAIKTPIGTLCVLALAVFLLERSFRAQKREDDEELKAIKAEIEKLKEQQNKD